MPVSAKFYSRISQRLLGIIAAIAPDDPSIHDQVLYLMNRHFGIKCHLPGNSNPGLIAKIVFETLRAEIDAAVERSRRCREAAARRREAKKDTKSVAKNTDIATADKLTEASHKENLTPPAGNLPETPADVHEKAPIEKPSSHAPQRPCSFKPLKFRPVVTVRQRNKKKFSRRR